MMSLAQIEAESRKAARRSAAKGLTPLVLWKPEEVFGAPFIGDRVPRGWRVLRYRDLVPGSTVTRYRRGFYGDDHRLGILLFVDTSGLGAPDEPALEVPALMQALRDILAAKPDRATIGFAIYEVGQFQAHLRVFVKQEARR